jgi:hypothetical protein
MRFWNWATGVAKCCHQWRYECRCGKWRLRCRTASVCSAITMETCGCTAKKFLRQFGKEQLIKITFLPYKWGVLFNETGWICERKSRTRPIIEANVNETRKDFVLSKPKNIKKTARQLSVPKFTVQKILRNCFKFDSYKYKLLKIVISQEKEAFYT